MELQLNALDWIVYGIILIIYYTAMPEQFTTNKDGRVIKRIFALAITIIYWAIFYFVDIDISLL